MEVDGHLGFKGIHEFHRSLPQRSLCLATACRALWATKSSAGSAS